MKREERDGIGVLKYIGTIVFAIPAVAFMIVTILLLMFTHILAWLAGFDFIGHIRICDDEAEDKYDGDDMQNR